MVQTKQEKAGDCESYLRASESAETARKREHCLSSYQMSSRRARASISSIGSDDVASTLLERLKVELDSSEMDSLKHTVEHMMAEGTFHLQH